MNSFVCICISTMEEPKIRKNKKLKNKRNQTEPKRNKPNKTKCCRKKEYTSQKQIKFRVVVANIFTAAEMKRPDGN